MYDQHSMQCAPRPLRRLALFEDLPTIRAVCSISTDSDFVLTQYAAATQAVTPWTMTGAKD
ncbi:hypothetical protein [Alloscardovia macacae]|uniref:Uncharacterized protein n=1 Tax=Alloscardovia macacae TaxID=1160091 RepID=A0A261F5U1_9BIFI|nr:hypothetical protein [Alloscardovia macacae]OZG54491.1 hypothetical protein ALMA_0952 [Alloscardovia macacae]